MEKVDTKRLIEILGKENVRDDPADRYVYGSDSSVHEASASVVVRPLNTEHVQEVVKYANSQKIPVIVRAPAQGCPVRLCPSTAALFLI